MSTARLVRFHDVEGCRAAIAVSGRTRLHLAVIDDGGVHVIDRPLVEERYAKPLDGTVRAAAKKMLGAGKRLGITKSARGLLLAAISQP